jgi:hypothetical protein
MDDAPDVKKRQSYWKTKKRSTRGEINISFGHYVMFCSNSYKPPAVDQLSEIDQPGHDSAAYVSVEASPEPPPINTRPAIIPTMESVYSSPISFLEPFDTEELAVAKYTDNQMRSGSFNYGDMVSPSSSIKHPDDIQSK